MEDKEFNEKYEQLKKSKFKQQKLWGWRPLPTISCITIIFISFAVFFILFGIIILVFTGQINEIKIRYKSCTNDHPCINTTITQKMKKPIMIYYELDNFSQNHRTYLEASKVYLETNGKCDNILDGNLCGLIENSYYQVKFTKWERNKDDIKKKDKDIAYKSDIEKFGKIEKYNDDEHFMIWMRPSPFSNPRKLWGIIEEDLEKGDLLEIYIKNNNEFNDNYVKYIILSTRNIFGGKSLFLGTFYILFGILCLIASITFIIAFNSFHKKKSKQIH